MNVPSKQIWIARSLAFAAALTAAVILLALSVARAAATDAEDQPDFDLVVATTDQADEVKPATFQLAVEPTPTPTTAHIVVVDTPANDEPDDLTIVEASVEPEDEATAEIEIAGPPPAPAALVVHRRMCETFVAEIADDVDALHDACPEPFSDEIGLVPVLLLNINGVTTPAFGGAAQVYEWDGLAPGTYSLGAETPAGFSDAPVVHCRVDAGNSPWQRYPSSHHVVTLDVEVQGAAVLCTWYEVPAPVNLIVRTWTCPPGVDPNEVDLLILSDECRTRLDAATLSVNTGGSVVGRDTIEGEAVWDGLLPAPVLVDSPVVPGYGEPVVYCFPDSDALQVAGNPLTVVDGAFDVDLSTFDGTGAICEWFAIPRPGLISVTKWLCPPDYDLSDPATDCATPYDGVQFAFGDGVGLWPMAVTGQAGPGRFFFSGLEPGLYTVAEDVPPGVVDHFVSCLKSVPSDNPMLGPALAAIDPEVVDGAIALDLGDNETIGCDWYNVPEEDGEGLGDDDGDAGTSDGDDEGFGEGDDQSGGPMGDSADAVDVVSLPNTGAGPATSAAEDSSPAWTGAGIFLTLWTIGHHLIRRNERPMPVPAASRTRSAQADCPYR